MKYLIIVPFLSLILTYDAFSDEKRSITVNGDCLKSVPQDKASITITADNKDNNSTAAAKKTNEEYNKLRDAIKKLNLPGQELQTTEYSVYEDYTWENQKRVSKGFKARMGLKIETTEISRIGEVISIATKMGIKDIGSLTTFVSVEKMKAEKELCLEEATKNSKIKADKMAKAAGAKIGKILNLHENATTSSQPTYPINNMMMMKGASEMNDSSPVVDSSSQKISVQILATYSLE